MENKTFCQQVADFVKANEKNIVQDIKDICAVKSIAGEPAPNAPFGVENRKALDMMLEKSRALGLDAVDCEGYLGYAEVKGKREEYIASIAHLDVVPEGNGWKADPFVVREVDGWLIGRGVCDDKGPAVITMYMLKFFKDHYPQLPYTLRALYGCEEETGMRDVEYYLENYPAPVFAFTPDANFPVCCGEKGIAAANLASAVITDGNVVEFTAGVASNVIPDRASLKVKTNGKDLPVCDGIEISVEDGVATLKAFGIGGHAAMPAGTKNAIGMLVNYCLDNDLLTAQEKEYFEVLKDLHSSTDGAGVGIASDDGIFTPLTCIGGMMKIEDGRFVQNINIRFPTSITGDEIKAKLTEKLAAVGGTVDMPRANPPFYVDKDSAPIKALVDAYNEITGKNEQAYTIGGGTYARHFPAAAAFGIEPSADETDYFPDFIGPVHGAEEGYDIKGFMRALEILIIATAKLMEVEF
ncbi:MAG: Sapep family Mn(2+)-dependent dipeptidase [Oscillospiraceae bacterium]|nr:Sapep family Mn(2+)-dependent dipeptidase [Oscillospiraceae bacterium]